MVVYLTPLQDVLTVQEKAYIEACKKLLSDTNPDPDCAIFQDMALLCYLYFAIDDINAHPTETFFTIDNWPKNWDALLIQGMQIEALAAQAILESGREVEMNDNGVVLSPPPVSATMKELHGTLIANYEERKERIKANVKPGGCAIGSTRVYGYGNTRVVSDRYRRFGRIF